MIFIDFRFINMMYDINGFGNIEPTLYSQDRSRCWILCANILFNILLTLMFMNDIGL